MGSERTGSAYVLCAALMAVLTGHVAAGAAESAETGPSIEEMLTVIESALERDRAGSPASRTDEDRTAPALPGEGARRAVAGAASAARGELDAALAQFDSLIKKGQYAAARRRAERASAETGLAPAGSFFRAAARIARALEERRGAIRRAMESNVGNTVTVWTSAGRRRGELESVSEAGMVLSAKVIVNREERGTTRFTVAWTDLTPAQEERLAEAWMPRGSDGEMALAVLAVLRKDAGSAERALAAAGEHPLAERYRGKLNALKAGPVEAAARRAWRRMERNARARELSVAAAEALLEEVAAFEKEHGGTEFAASMADEIVATRARADAALAAVVGLVGHWKFDESRGATASDSSGNGGHGKLEGPTWAAGKRGGALRFGGSGQVLIENPERYELGAADFTIAAWIETQADGTIVAKAPGAGGWAHDAKAFFVRGGRLHFDSGWVGVLATSRRVVDGEWHHVAVTFSDATNALRLYVDGVHDGSRTLPLRPDVEGHLLKLGFASPNFPKASRFNGLIDDVRIYDRALTGREIGVLYEDGAGPSAGPTSERTDAAGEQEAGTVGKVPAWNASLAMTFDQGTVVYNRREGVWSVLDLSRHRNHGRIRGSFAGDPRTGEALVFRRAEDVPDEYDMALVVGPSGRKGDCAMYFAGREGYIEVRDDLNSYPLGISLALLATDASSRQYVVSSDRPGRHGSGFGIVHGRFEIDYHNSFRRCGRVAEDRWMSVRLAYAADEITIWVDNRKVDSFADHRGTPMDGREDYYIGRHSSSLHLSFKGVLDDIRVVK